MADRQALLLVHGFPLDSRMWHHQVEALNTSMRVLAPDLAGHGGNGDTPATSVDAMARSLAAHLDDARVDAVHLAGFSMGGYASFAFLRLFPERVLSLSLVDTRASADNEAGREGRDAMIARLRAEGPQVAAEAMLPRMFTESFDAGLRAGVEQWMLLQPVETMVADLMTMRDRPDSTPMLSQIKVPVLVVVGNEDPITPPADSRMMAESIPGAGLVVVEGAAHLAPVERPEVVNIALLGFLDG